MGLIDFSVKRYVAIFCLIIALTGLGLNSYRKLPLEELPKTDMPYVTVFTIYPGASPAEIETDIAKPIEDAVGTIDGLKNITSSCMENACQTLLEFNIGVDFDQAANDVREKVDLILNNFPDGVGKPKILKFDVNAQPIINLAVTGEIPLIDLYDYVDNEFADKLSSIPGVADIQLIGGAKQRISIELDRSALAARNLTSLDIVKAIKSEIKLIPSGRVRHEGQEFSIKFDADYKEISEIEDLEIANTNAQRCYLRDVAKVILSTEELRQLATVNGKSCIAVKIVKKAEANAVEVVKRVKEQIAKLKATLPGGVEVIWVSDMGNYIQASVDSAVSNIWQGILLTSVLMFFFLYNFRSTIIVAITMPLTIICGLFMLYLLAYSLNTCTLLALGLSIGILVTNSIVVLESIVSKLQKGDSPASASINGTKEVLIAILASAGTNVVVLFPVSLMKGQIGQFFIPFALTMVGITGISLIISFTLTPATSGQLLKEKTDSDNTETGLLLKMEKAWNSAFDFMVAGFTSFIQKIFRKRVLSILILFISALLLLQSLSLVPAIGFSFIPRTDRGELVLKLEFPTSYSLEATRERVKEINESLINLPYIKNRLVTIGKIDGTVGQTSEGVHLAQILCIFSDKNQRNQGIEELADLVRKKVENLPDLIATVTLPDSVGAGADLKMVIKGPDFSELDRLGLAVAKESIKLDEIVDVDTSIRPGKPEIRVTPRRAILSDLKIPATMLGMMLRTNIEGANAGTFKKNSRTYDIVVKLKEKQGLEQIASLELPGMAGHPVILENFADVTRKIASVLITRRNKERASVIYSNLKKGAPLGTAADKVANILEKQIQLPPGYSYEFFGKIEAMKEGQRDFLEVGITAFLLTYLLLCSILNSFKRPIIILLTIPLGLMGSLWSLYLTGESISMMVLLGSVMLIGIVVNNAILIMDKVQEEMESGITPEEAMLNALRSRMRAIVMITLAAILGMLPMAIDQSLGSEQRSGIGIAAIGGLLISTIFTMIVLPIMFNLANKNTKA